MVRPLTDAERQAVEAGPRSSTALTRRRAQVVLASVRGDRRDVIVRPFGSDEQTVRNALHAFNTGGDQEDDLFGGDGADSFDSCSLTVITKSDRWGRCAHRRSAIPMAGVGPGTSRNCVRNCGLSGWWMWVGIDRLDSTDAAVHQWQTE